VELSRRILRPLVITKLLAVWGIILVGVIFRFWKIDTIPGVNGDEAWLGWKAFQVAHGAKLDWITYSGNITDPFYILPLIGLHKIFSPSAFLLRSVALMSGLLVLPVNFLFCRWVYGRESAWGTTLLLAVLPVNIVYSRFGWEPSQSVLFALPPLYLALALGSGKLRPIVGILLFGIALVSAFLVHPTNFFLGAFGIAALASISVHPEHSLRRFLFYIGLVFIGVASLGVIAFLRSPGGVHDEIVTRMCGVGWIHDADRFVLVLVRFFNGLNSLPFIPGSWRESCSILDMDKKPWVGWPDWLGLVIGLVASIVMAVSVSLSSRRYTRFSSGLEMDRTDLILLLGLITSLVLFDFLTGPEKVAVWFDRYGLWMVPPGVLFLTRAVLILKGAIPSIKSVIRFGGLVVCVLLLAESWSGYFQFALSTGGNSEMDARIGSEDVKLAAARLIVNSGNRSAITSPVLVSSDWFVYWPILYFLRKEPGWKKWESVREDLYPHSFPVALSGWNLTEAVSQGRVVFAEYSCSSAWSIWNPLIRDSGVDYETHEFQDIAGRPVLKVRCPVDKAVHNEQF